MNWIKKKAIPRSLVKYKKAANATYLDIDSSIKKELQESLWKEQKGICAYCQRRIKEATSKYMKVEHHCEYSICNGNDGNPDLRLDYNNLLAVCLGGQGSKLNHQHCDTRKGHAAVKKYLPIEIKPTAVAHINTISYQKGGTIKSSIEKHDIEINKVLNLNIEFLKDERKDIYKIYLKSCFKNGSWDKPKLKKMVEKYTATKDGLYQHNFPRLSTFLLQKYG